MANQDKINELIEKRAKAKLGGGEKTNRFSTRKRKINRS